MVNEVVSKYIDFMLSVILNLILDIFSNLENLVNKVEYSFNGAQSYDFEKRAVCKLSTTLVL